jgi:regulator of sirC expression with transglutaminase-like and TPR domain
MKTIAGHVRVSAQHLEEIKLAAEDERELYEALSRQVGWSCSDGTYYQAGRGSKVYEAPS